MIPNSHAQLSSDVKSVTMQSMYRLIVARSPNQHDALGKLVSPRIQCKLFTIVVISPTNK